MTKKVYSLISGITLGVGTIAAAVVSFVNPQFETAIIASIGIAETAVIEVCSQFVKEK